MTHSILKKHIAFITAHPDDETFLAAGTIYRNNRDGGTSSLFCATLGEKGTSYASTSESVEIKQIRERELSAVAKFLGIQNIETSNFPDGGMDEYFEECIKKFARLSFESNPKF